MGAGPLPKMPYIIGHPVHQRAECPAAPAGHFARKRESKGNGGHTDFGIKSSMLYPSRRGTGAQGGWRESSPLCDRTENEVKAGVGIDTRRSARFQKP